MKTEELNNIIAISDLHAGSRIALCPPTGIRLDDGGRYTPSPLQRKLWRMWRFVWDEWVPEATRREPFGIVVNGDAVEGRHHDDVTVVSHNPEDQAEIAYQLLAPLVDLCKGRLWFIRGTQAHVGPSAHTEENLAKRIGARPNTEGQFARWELWKLLGGKAKLVHFMHHVGTVTSNAYEATAVHKELVEAFFEAGRWGDRPPDMIVRSHRHRSIITGVPGTPGGSLEHGASGFCWGVVTPAWQAKTPFTYRAAGARQAQPQFGATLVRYAHSRLFADAKVWRLERSKPE